MPKMYPELKSSRVIKKFEGNPILTKDDVPYDASLVFNAGVAKLNGKYYMVFRNDYGMQEEGYPGWWSNGGTALGVAECDDGKQWTVRPKPLYDSANIENPEIKRFYDPRLTIIENEIYICFAVDTRHGIRGGIGKIIGDFEGLEIISMTAPDNRNMVLFPEKINGLYARLERPFPVYGRGRKDRFDVWISFSPDLKFWGETKLLLGVEDVPFANDKIGPAAPPIKTDKGWLTTFHAVDLDKTRGKNGWEEKWDKRYCGGIMLLDLNDPSKIIGMSKEPLIAPELSYETDEGYRHDVIFPGGMVAEPDGEVKIYYGASDTVECLATAKLDDLLELCINK